VGHLLNGVVVVDTSGQEKPVLAFCSECGAELLNPSGRYCQYCGSAIPRPHVDGEHAKVVEERKSADQGHPSAGGISEEKSGRKPSQRKRAVILSIGVAVIIAIVVSVVLVASNQGETISYHDGYHYGYNNESVFLNSFQDTSGDICQNESFNVPGDQFSGDIPQGDNKSQWVAGCLAGVHSYVFHARHPGAGG
jgi:hypothetical protein